MDDLSHAQALILLQSVKGLGPRRIEQILSYYHDAFSVFTDDLSPIKALPSSIFNELLAIQQQGSRHQYWQKMLRQWEYLQKSDIHMISMLDDAYPPLLKEIQAAPPLLYLKGNPACLKQPQLAVVGARKATKQSLQLSYDWAYYIAQQGLTITSGLAIGIDGAAHQAALDVNQSTIAVLAHGIDSLYPKQHQAMADAIIEKGALISEFSLGTKAQREHFPRRNRIITGLSLGVLVTEAALKSGTMISAQYAIEQSREVFAVPGFVNNLRVAGCNRLIQDGAYLATCPDDILQCLQWQSHHASPAQQTPALSSSLQLLLENIDFQPTHLDDIIEKTGFKAAEVASQLLELELLNVIECIAGNYQRIR